MTTPADRDARTHDRADLAELIAFELGVQLELSPGCMTSILLSKHLCSQVFADAAGDLAHRDGEPGHEGGPAITGLGWLNTILDAAGIPRIAAMVRNGKLEGFTIYANPAAAPKDAEDEESQKQ